MSNPFPLPVRTHTAISAIPAREWNALLPPAAPPFLRHEFLATLETSGCVSPATGWQPCHLSVTDASGSLLAAMPLYEKSHSWGEFVFDWAWADAYRRAGLAYYPKLVSTVPFTPATSPRILRPSTTAVSTLQMIGAAIDVAKATQASSLHLQFVDADTAGRARQHGLAVRKDCQFHWRNNGYGDFDAFLATFSSAKRKKVRRERRRVREAGVTFEHLHGTEIGESDWDAAWNLTRSTFMCRGNEPYLSLEFFVEAARLLPQMFHVVLASHSAKRIAAAIFFRGPDTLYGRYWGSDADYHSLHFETCYYQGIDYCIAAGLKNFEPGTQGEHKVSRGFLPVQTWSAHWLDHPQFARAIDAYSKLEVDSIDAYMDAVNQHTPYRSDTP